MADREQDDYRFIELVCGEITAKMFSKLSAELGFSPAQTERIVLDHNIYGRKQVYRRMLQTWVNRSKVPATKEMLAQHFTNINEHFLATKLCPGNTNNGEAAHVDGAPDSLSSGHLTAVSRKNEKCTSKYP